VGVRAKYGEDLVQFAIHENFVLLLTPRVRGVTPFVRGGLGILQFERVDGRFAFGMFSPTAELGIMIRLWTRDDTPIQQGAVVRRRRRSLMLTLSAGTEYTLRFGSVHQNRGYWGIQLGISRGDEMSTRVREPTEPCPARLEAGCHE